MTWRFAEPAAFNYLMLLPLLVAAMVILVSRKRKKILNQFGERIGLFLSSSVSSQKRWLKVFLQSAALLFFVLALARLQTGEKKQKIKSEGIELILAVDVSNSMMVEDAKPNRLELTKREIERFIDKRAGDKMGLVAFAGSGVLLSPMTPDKSAIKMYVESLSPEAVSTQGTDFKRALKEAGDAFKRGGLEPEEAISLSKAVVIFSDGEDNESGALEMAKELKEQGVRVFGFAVGTEKGGAIPLKDDRGEFRGYRKDRSGKVVLSVARGDTLREIAEVGGGSFYHLTPGGANLDQMVADLQKLSSSEFDSAEISNYQENYQAFLFLGLLLALFEMFLGERRPEGRLWRGRFEVMPE